VTAVAITPAAVVREAHAVLHLAIEAPWACEAVQAAAVSLGDALETYAELDGNGLHWECVYPHLGDEADPDDTALRMAAEEAESAADDLIRVMAAHCGTEDETKNAAGEAR
jgi:hypothetical protein